VIGNDVEERERENMARNSVGALYTLGCFSSTLSRSTSGWEACAAATTRHPRRKGGERERERERKREAGAHLAIKNTY
jgi:hypothetical protein